MSRLAYFFIFDQILFTAFMYVVSLGGLDTCREFSITLKVETVCESSATQKDTGKMLGTIVTMGNELGCE
jgi:hypothetical protein